MGADDVREVVARVPTVDRGAHGGAQPLLPQRDDCSRRRSGVLVPEDGETLTLDEQLGYDLASAQSSPTPMSTASAGSSG